MFSPVLPALRAANGNGLQSLEEALYLKKGAFGDTKERLFARWGQSVSPNFSEWLPGDFMLVESDGSALSRAIVLAQLTSVNAATRAGMRFTHAAIYIGMGRIIDATLDSGVRERSVWDYCETRAIAVRRIPGLNNDERLALVQAASYRIGQPYSWLAALTSKLVPKAKPEDHGVYCSALAGLCAEATGRSLTRRLKHLPLYPGTLFGHEDLTVLPLEWRQIK